MIRISISFFYKLGATLHRLSEIKPDVKLIESWVTLNNARTELEGLFSTDWFMPAVKSAYWPGHRLIGAIKTITDGPDLDFDAILTQLDIYPVTHALAEFETVIQNELVIADSYFVTRKAGYDTSTLITNAEKCFPADVMTKVPLAVNDLREAGKCLAFEVSTAAGFHALRATEATLRAYWSAVAKGKAHPKNNTLGSYLKQLNDHDLGSKKARAALQQIKDLHRNPLMHPQETLTLDDAVMLFGICQSAIGAMLREIPPPKAGVASP